MMPVYKAILHDTSNPQPEPDRYGTLTLPALASSVSTSIVAVQIWARSQLKTAGRGSYVDITVTSESVVERIEKDESPNKG